jgi:hypothetical protein
VHAEQTGRRTIDTSCEEHETHAWATEHRFETGHIIDVSNTAIPDKAPGYMDRLIKEAIEIRLHPRNFDRDRGSNLSRSWYPLI